MSSSAIRPSRPATTGTDRPARARCRPGIGRRTWGVARYIAHAAGARPLGPGEAPLDELERAFRDTLGPEPEAAAAPVPKSSWRTAAWRPRTRTQASPKQTTRPNATRSGPRAGPANKSIRVHVDTLEQLMTMVSELVLTRNQLLEIVRRHEDSEFKAPLQRLSNVTAELQEGVMKTRMQPIGNAWQKLPRIVRDLSNELGKPIELEMHGAETELDRQVLDLIKDPLTHMVRNSADHGIEIAGRASRRRQAGKGHHPPLGLARGRPHHHRDRRRRARPRCRSDQGRGAVARARVGGRARRRCRTRRFSSSSSRPAFPPPRQVTSVSGRGVGMDVVRANIDQIGGTIDVKSVLGRGTSFTIKIPLTLAIVSALIVEAGGDRFAIPQLAVVELVRVRSNSEHRIERIKDAAGAAAAQQAAAAGHAQDPAQDRDDAEGESEQRLHRGDAGRQPDLRRRGRRRVPHRGNRGQADVEPAAQYPGVLAATPSWATASVIMIIDPNGVAHTIGSTAAAQRAAA